jgi:signal transduction histidine kinase
LKKLFSIEEKFSKEGTAREQGTGLGLILCKEFIEKNSGWIWAESKPGEGSSFKFTLPKEQL